MVVLIEHLVVDYILVLLVEVFMVKSYKRVIDMPFLFEFYFNYAPNPPRPT